MRGLSFPTAVAESRRISREGEYKLWFNVSNKKDDSHADDSVECIRVSFE